MLIMLFLLICLNSYAPNHRTIAILQREVFNVYDNLIAAIIAVESHGDTLALNIKEQAVGLFQIRQCRVDHFNQLTGKNYQLWEMFDYDKSREVFILFANLLQEPEIIAKRWNGSGPQTETYWNKVKGLL